MGDGKRKFSLIVRMNLSKVAVTNSDERLSAEIGQVLETGEIRNFATEIPTGSVGRVQKAMVIISNIPDITQNWRYSVAIKTSFSCAMYPFKLSKLGNGFNGCSEEESNENGDLAKIPRIFHTFETCSACARSREREKNSRKGDSKNVSVFQGQRSLACVSSVVKFYDSMAVSHSNGEAFRFSRAKLTALSVLHRANAKPVLENTFRVREIRPRLQRQRGKVEKAKGALCGNSCAKSDGNKLCVGVQKCTLDKNVRGNFRKTSLQFVRDEAWKIASKVKNFKAKSFKNF